MSDSVDTGTVFKHPVFCACCNQDYLFTLRAIADNAELKCPTCGNSINICDDGYRHLVSHVRETLEAIR
jgi:hypothetical protein